MERFQYNPSALKNLSFHYVSSGRRRSLLGWNILLYHRTPCQCKAVAIWWELQQQDFVVLDQVKWQWRYWVGLSQPFAGNRDLSRESRALPKLCRRGLLIWDLEDDRQDWEIFHWLQWNRLLGKRQTRRWGFCEYLIRYIHNCFAKAVWFDWLLGSFRNRKEEFRWV